MAGRRLLLPYRNPVLDENGLPVSNARAAFYVTDTNTLGTVYADQALTTPLANPVIADSAGVLPTIWADESTEFDFAVRRSDGTTIYGMRDLSALTPAVAVGDGLLVATAFAQALLDDDTAADARTTLAAAGVVTAATSLAASSYPSVQAAYNAASRDVLSGDGQVTINLTGHVSLSAPLRISSPFADRIKLRGQTAVSTTLSGIVSVTGSVGAWSVTGNLADASSVSVGDVLLLRGVTPGVLPPGEYASAPPKGQINLAFFTLGGSAPRAYLKTVGTTATVWTDAACATTPASAVDDFLTDGDIVIVKGEVRSVSGVTASGFTLSAALARNVTGLQYWYLLPNMTGTVTCAGTTVTGTGTAFDTEFNVDDEIFIAGAGCARVTAIASATSLTIDRSLTATGANFAVWIPGETHDGAWVVTAINVGGNANRVTWTNKNRTTLFKPRANGVTGGAVSVLRTVVSCSGGGVVIQNGQADIDHIAFVGAGEGYGIDCRGYDQSLPANPSAQPGFAGRAVIGTKAAFSGFNYGAWIEQGASLFARYAFFCGNDERGINNNFGGRVDVLGATCAGNGSFGMLIGPGATANWSDFRAFGNGTDGVSLYTSGASYAEFPYLEGNGAVGIRFDDACSMHMNGQRNAFNASGGVQADNGGYGRMTGSVVIANTGTGIAWANALYECSQTLVMGNVTGLIASNQAMVYVAEMGLGSNSSNALRALTGARITGADVVVNGAIGPLCEEGCKITLPDVAFVGGPFVTAYGGGACIYIQGYAGSATFSPATLNQADAAGNIVDAGSDVAREPSHPAISLTGRGLLLTGDLSASQITSDQSDYNPAGLATASVLRLSSDASRSITGLQGGADGRVITIYNIGSFDILLTNESASSTAANRFLLPFASARVPSLGGISLIYDSTSSRWRPISAVTRVVPRFEAYLSADQTVSTTGSWVLVAFDTEAFDYGGNFNTANGKFVAPYAGTYSFTVGVTITSDGTAPSTYRVGLAKNGTTLNRTINRVSRLDILSATITRTIELAANDEVTAVVYLDGADSPVEADNSVFSGFLVA